MAQLTDQEKVKMAEKVHSMSAAFTLDLILHSRVDQSIMLVGDHGVGKDGIIKTAAQILNIPVIDIRLSQNDVGDIKGMPIRWKGRTLFAPPDWMPLQKEEYEGLDELMDEVESQASALAHAEAGILFFNELNRACREVQQVVFQVSLDRTMGTRRLKDGWRILSAINGEDHYITTILDLALKSRFRLVRFKPTVEEWLKWAVENNLHPVVIEFIRRFNGMLDPSQELLQQGATRIDMQVRNRRAWHMLSDDIYHREELAREGKVPEPVTKETNELNQMQLRAMTYVDSLAAIQFMNFIKTDYQSLSGDIILNHWDKEVSNKIRAIVKADRVAELARYCDMIVEIAGQDKLTNNQKANLTAFVKLLPRESRMRLYKHYLHEAKKSCLDWYEDPEVRKLITDALIKKQD